METDIAPVAGAEQKATQPVLIISNEEFNESMPDVTILPLTLTGRALYPAEVSLPAGKVGQLPDTIVMAHQISTVPKQRLRGPIGHLEDPQLRKEVSAAIKAHLDLE